MANIKLASAGDNIKLWDATNYSLNHEYNPHTTTVADICWSYDGQFLASASSTGDKLMVAYVNLDYFSVCEVSPKIDQQCACFSRNTSRHLLSGGKNGELNLWDLKLHQVKKIYTGHTAPVTKVQFNWNDTAILSGSTRGDVILHNVITGMASAPLRLPKVQAIRDLKYSATKRSLFATASDDGMINLWDANSRNMIHSYKDAHGAPAMALAFSPVNEMLLTSVGLDKKIVCFDVKTKTAVKSLTSDQPFTSMDFYRDGVTLAVGSTRGKIYVYDLRQSATPVRTFSAHKTSVQGLNYQTLKANTASKSQGGGNANRSASLSPKRLLGMHQVSSSSSLTGSVSQIPQLATKQTIKEKLFQVNGIAATESTFEDQSHQKTSAHTRSLSDDIYSPLRDDSSIERPNAVREQPTTPNYQSHQETFSRIRNLSDDIFSPLRDDSSVEKPNTGRKQPIGSGSSPYTFGDRPVTAGVEDSEFSSTLNSSFTETILRPLSPPSAPRRRSASFSPRTSRNVAQERCKVQFGSTTTSSTVIDHCSTNTGDTTSVSTVSKTPVVRQIPPYKDTEEPILPESLFLLSNGGPPSEQTAVTGSIVIPCNSLEEMKRFMEDSFEEMNELIQKKYQQLRIDILREFQIQKNEMEALLQRYAINDELLSEVERLREENRRLQTKF